MSVEAPMKLTPDESVLLKAMRNGIRPLVRATTGRAVYFGSAGGERDCTIALAGLLKQKLVEIDTIDRRVGWVTYKPK